MLWPTHSSLSSTLAFPARCEIISRTVFCERHHLTLAKLILWRGEVVLHHSYNTRRTVSSAATTSLKNGIHPVRVNAAVIHGLLSARLSCCHHTHHGTPLGKARCSMTAECERGLMYLPPSLDSLDTAFLTPALITLQPHPSLLLTFNETPTSGIFTNYFDIFWEGIHTHKQQHWDLYREIQAVEGYLILSVHMVFKAPFFSCSKWIESMQQHFTT